MVNIQPALRKIIIFELVFPIVLLIVGIYHGLLQFLYRAGWLRQVSFGGLEYYQGLTLHGVINAIVFTTFFAVAFGNALIPYFLGKHPSVKVAVISGVTMAIGTVMAAIPIFTGSASVLYTFYPPLKAHPSFYIGVTLLVVGSWLAFWGWIPVYRSWRKENPGKKIPLAILGIFTTFLVWQIATAPVAYEVLVLLLPWSLGWTDTVNVVLARTLFWFFGHPLVYFWILPAYIMYYTMLPKLVGGKLFSDFAGRLAFLWLLVFSSPLGLHHQFTEPGLDSNWKLAHAFLTFLVAVPSIMTAFVVAASMEYGARARGGKGLFGWWSKLPWFEQDAWLFGYFICGLILFIFGGITGIVNASYSMNRVVHNTAWLPAHFHMTVAGPAFLAFIGMSLHMISQLTGKAIRYPSMNLWFPYIWSIGIFVSSTGAFIGGLQGMPRRTNMGLTYLNPESVYFRGDWIFPSNIAVIGGIIMTIAMVMFFTVVFATLFSKKTMQEGIEFPVAEAYHDEDYAVVRNMKPWIAAAVAAVAIAYTPPLYEIYKNKVKGAAAFLPSSPVPASGTG
ncbi:MAG TPA: cbb3-type cytochrome c oxidase subunit I, partial [Pseudobdellovibrionaceae bacterium]